jgi:hypothetical protein
MRFTLNIRQCRRKDLLGAAIATGLLAIPQFAAADSAFVNQAGGGFAGKFPVIGFSGSGAGNPSVPFEMVAARRAGPNVAGSLMAGNNNSVVQLQGGAGNRSAVGILGGQRDSVNVLQAGNSLQSGVLLLGVSGLHLNVIQPPNAPPFGLVIAHLPDGGWFVRRR